MQTLVETQPRLPRRFTMAVAGCTTTNAGNRGGLAATVAASGRPVAVGPHAWRPVARPCAAVMVRISAGRDGEGPGAHGDIEFTDISRARCVLRGLPAVAIATSAGKLLPVTLTRAAGVTAQQVVVAPGRADAAELAVFWSDWCGRVLGPVTVRVTLPAGGGTVTGWFDGPPDYDLVPRRLDAHQGSTVWVVAAYYAGAVS